MVLKNWELYAEVIPQALSGARMERMTPGLRGYWECLQLDVFSCSQVQSTGGY